MRGAPATMPRGLRSAIAFAACTFATLLPAPGASHGVTLLSDAPVAFHVAVILVIGCPCCFASYLDAMRRMVA